MVEINLSLKQIYEVACPDCKKKILDLAADEGARAAVREGLVKSLSKEAGAGQ